MADPARDTDPDGVARFEAEVLRAAFSVFPSGVTTLAAERDGRLVGIAASSFTSVSLDPPLVSVCLARTSTTWPVLRDGPRLGVSVLADDQQDVARQFAARDLDRFAGVRHVRRPSGAVLVEQACLWLECTLYAELPAGDHVIALLEVQQLDTFPQRAPLVFHSSEYRRLLFPG